MRLTLTGSGGGGSPAYLHSTHLKNLISTTNLARGGLEVPITLRQDNPSIAQSFLPVAFEPRPPRRQSGGNDRQ